MEIEIHSLPPRRELTGDQIMRIKKLCVLFGPVNLEAWSPVREVIETFMRDMHPEGEIRLWEHMAELFKIEMVDRDEGEHRELYRVILSISFGSTIETDLSDVDRIKERWKKLPHKWIKEAYLKDNC